jgi:hypothetical protein
MKFGSTGNYIRGYMKVQCWACNTIIEAVFKHDYVACKCLIDPISIDGGTDYTRISGPPYKIIEVEND